MVIFNAKGAKFAQRGTKFLNFCHKATKAQKNPLQSFETSDSETWQY